MASYECEGTSGSAEFAVAVADHAHHRGVATLLLEHLVSVARDQGDADLHRRGAGREFRDAEGIRRRGAARPPQVGGRRR